MNLIDITLTLSEELPTWPGDPPIKLNKISRIQDGADANVTAMSMAVHAGTHVDAPHHFVDDSYSAEDIPLDLMVGPATVIDLPVRETITRKDLEQAAIPAYSKRLLLKTSNSKHWEEKDYQFKKDFIALGVDAAEYLVERGTTLVGVDYLSVATYDDPVPTHQTLLKAGILVIESLNLSRADAGDYSLLCLPLKITGSDGAPARVLLMR